MVGYLRRSYENVRALAQAGVGGVDVSKIEDLADRPALLRASGYSTIVGESGYVNWSSGWVDAAAGVRYAVRSLSAEAEGRVVIKTGTKVSQLLLGPSGNSSGKTRCTGVALEDGSEVLGDLMVLAAGAWTPSLIDLRGRAVATGQTLAYIRITEEEQRRLESRPTMMNMNTGIFVIPPRAGELKIARHGYGYRNMMQVVLAGGVPAEVSVPEVGIAIPWEGEQACRDGLKALLPQLADRPFSRTRVCWYCDT
jgi:sarcosine oxidase / L-pipecolate oxidase